MRTDGWAAGQPHADLQTARAGRNARIRVGLLLGGETIPAWVDRMLDEMQASGDVEIVLAVVDAGGKTGTLSPSLASLLLRQPGEAAKRVLRGVLERLMSRLNEPFPAHPDPFAPLDWHSRLPGVPRIDVRPQRTRWSDRFEAADIEAIRHHHPDLLIRIGFRILRGDILQAARHGVWSFHHGDNDVNRGGPAAYWESMQSWPVTGSTLQVLSEHLDGGIVLDKTWCPTDAGSTAANRHALYWGALSMMARNLTALRRQGAEAYFGGSRQCQPHPRWYSRRLYRAPTKAQLAALLWQRLLRRARLRLAAATGFDQWQMLLHVSDSLSLEPWRYRRLVPPRDRFWADPFLLQHEGRTWLFFEELPFATGRGHIAVAEIGTDGHMSAPRPALMLDHHLSYPFVFTHRGQVYMLPESREARCVPLYRCVEMPHRWEKVHHLLDDVEAVDATLHEHGGRWWMFVNIVAHPGASSCVELHLFHADEPTSRAWQPHPQNPVVSDARRARPAGQLFEHEGRLYRPSQDCSHRYGWALNINWVKTLTPEVYEEERVSRAEPRWAPDVRGIHTFNRAGPFHVIDAEVRRSRWS